MTDERMSLLVDIISAVALVIIFLLLWSLTP